MERRKKTNSTLAKAGKIMHSTPPESDLKILAYIKEHKTATFHEIAHAIGIDSTTVSRRAPRLIKEGLIIRTRQGREVGLRWVGGTPALEAEIEKANLHQVPASLMAEYYDVLITNPFRYFGLIFEENYWEIVSNLSLGLNDVEVGQRVGKAISLDSIRRMLVILQEHKFIKLKNLRSPALVSIQSLYEPLYRIESVDTERVAFLHILRGLASAFFYESSFKKEGNKIHLYHPILESSLKIYNNLNNNILSSETISDQEVLSLVLKNYDYSKDMERALGRGGREKIRSCKYAIYDTNSEHILVNKSTIDEWSTKI